jgi:anti-anti-sigma factor
VRARLRAPPRPERTNQQANQGCPADGTAPLTASYTHNDEEVPAVDEALPPEELSVRLDTALGYAVATVEGPIDLGNHTVLAERLAQALTLSGAALVVDMSAVGFCDSSGLGVFARMIRETRVRGMTLVLTGLRERVADLFTMTRLDQEIYLQPSVDSALHWLETGQPAGSS